jgi:hypothetical protein
MRILSKVPDEWPAIKNRVFSKNSFIHVVSRFWSQWHSLNAFSEQNVENSALNTLFELPPSLFCPLIPKISRHQTSSTASRFSTSARAPACSASGSLRGCAATARTAARASWSRIRCQPATSPHSASICPFPHPSIAHPLPTLSLSVECPSSS